MDYIQLRNNFIQAMQDGDPDAQHEWMGTVINYEDCKRYGIPYDDKAPRKLRDLESVFLQSLDYSKGPTHGDLIVLLRMAMMSTDLELQFAAKGFVNRCADIWAIMNEDEE